MLTPLSDRRRSYTVSRKIHRLYYITWILVFLLILLFLVFALLLYRGGALSAQAPTLFGYNIFIFIGLVAFLLIFFSLFLGVCVIRHTHRMLGSAYRINLGLSRILDGDRSERIQLREEDYFRDIADGVNTLAERLSQGESKVSGSTKND